MNEIDETLRRKRVRNRWYKTVTLINNPSLVFDRLMKRYQQEMKAAGGDKDDGFRLKVGLILCVIKLPILSLFGARSESEL